MDKGKTGKKTGKHTMTSPRSGATVPTGAHPKNTGGKKGRSGRKPLPFKELCKDILEDPVTQQKVREAAQNPAAPGYSALIKALAAYAEGLPQQTHKHKGDEGAPIEFTLKIGDHDGGSS